MYISNNLTNTILQRKAIISFSSRNQKKFKILTNRDQSGQVHREQLSAKGQLFVVTSILNDRNESGEATDVIINIINDIYYSHPSNDVSSSLNHALRDAYTLFHELYNTNGHSEKLRLSFTALVLTKDRVSIAQIGNNQVYRITPHNVEKLTCNNMNGTSQQLNQNHSLDFTSELQFDVNHDIPLKIGDGYLLCTDGLVNVNHQEMKKIVLSNPPEEASEKLIKMAKESGINQDMDVQVIRINAAPAKPFLTPFNNTRIAFSNKIHWLTTALILLFVVVLYFNFSDNLPNNKNDLSNQLRLQKEEILANPQEPSKLKIAESQKASVLIPGLPQNSPEPITSRNNAKPLTGSDSNTKAMSPETREPAIEEPTVNQSLQGNSLKYDRLNIFKGMLTDKWEFQNLSDSDFKITEDKVIFLDSPKRKKALYRTKFSDLSFQVQARVLKSNLTGRYGIIVGYHSVASSPLETYYLISIHEQKQLVLQKHSNFKKELIASIPLTKELINNLHNIQLKILSHGPYLEIYANQEHLYLWEHEERITGQIGFYVDPHIHVEFSDFKTSNSWYLKRMILNSRNNK